MLTEPAPSVQQFFQSYRRAFEQYDADGIGELFAYPGLVISDDDEVDLTPVAIRREWVRNLEHLLGTYRRIRFASARILELAAAELSPRLHQAVVHWELYDDADRTLYDFQATYTLAEAGGGLRIAAVAHNELPRLRARLAEH